MTNRSSLDEFSTESTTNTQTFLQTCALDVDHKALEEYLVSNQVQQSDLDRCLLRGLQIVQQKVRELSHVAPALTLLLQSGAKWNRDVLLDEDKTPYHIICESPGDHHELLELMIKSSQQTIIDAHDLSKRTALLYAVRCANMNCVMALIYAAISNSMDVASYLLNKYTYPLNIEYRGSRRNSLIFTILTEPRSVLSSRITKLLIDHGADPAKPMCSKTSVNAIMTAIAFGRLKVIAQYIRSGVDINLRSYDRIYLQTLPFEASVLRGHYDIAKTLLISGCSCGVFSLKSNHKFTYLYKNKLKPDLVKLMEEWKIGENNVTPLKQRCRSVILTHLSPRADMKIGELPLPGWIIKFLNISEIDEMVDQIIDLCDVMPLSSRRL